MKELYLLYLQTKNWWCVKTKLKSATYVELTTNHGKNVIKLILFLAQKKIQSDGKVALNTYKIPITIFNEKHQSEEVQLRIFETFIQCIFHYNSELWTITKTLEKETDLFETKFLRRDICVYWPRIISSEDLYNRTKTKQWSTNIFN